MVNYGETKLVHFEEMQEREWFLKDQIVDELYEYKTLGVLKNSIGSFSSIVTDNVNKLGRKPGLSFHLILIAAKLTRQKFLGSYAGSYRILTRIL